MLVHLTSSIEIKAKKWPALAFCYSIINNLNFKRAQLIFLQEYTSIYDHMLIGREYLGCSPKLYNDHRKNTFTVDKAMH